MKFNFLLKCAFLVLGMFFLSNYQAYATDLAASISGVVTDAETGEPLIGATVYEMSTRRGTITDIDGSYTLNVSKIPTSINVSYTGYVLRIIEVTQEGSLDVQLDASVSRLDEIVIVGTRGKPRTILDSPVPIDNINAAELKLSGQTSVDQMINFRVPSYNSANQTVSDATAHFDHPN